MSESKGIVQIHGKDYMTVARRVEVAHEAKTLEGIETEVLNHNPVVIKAKVTIKGKVFTGISSVSLDTGKMIEKNNPYEVAETSAVGRALGFAGYGIIDSIASADEVSKSIAQERQENASYASENGSQRVNTANAVCWSCNAPSGKPHASNCEAAAPVGVNNDPEATNVTCSTCGKPATERKGTSKAGRAYHGIFCSTDNKEHTRWLWN